MIIDSDINIICGNGDLKGDQNDHTILRNYVMQWVKGGTLVNPVSIFYIMTAIKPNPHQSTKKPLEFYSEREFEMGWMSMT
jgi:hypothetical protein